MKTGSAVVRRSQLAESLDTAGPRIADSIAALPEVALGELEIGGEMTLQEARRLAPRDRGDLRSSLRARLMGSRVSLSLPARYAPIEFGGHIRPRRSAYLAVPIAPGARSLPGPRSDGDLIVVVARDGRRFLGRRSSIGMQLRWKLETSVRIQGRGFLSRATARAAKEYPEQVLSSMEREILDG